MGNMKNSILDNIGGMVDEIFLVPPRILSRFKPARAIERNTYEGQIYFCAIFITSGSTWIARACGPSGQ